MSTWICPDEQPSGQETPQMVFKPQPRRPIQRWSALEAERGENNVTPNICTEWCLPDLFESVVRTPTPGVSDDASIITESRRQKTVSPVIRDEESTDCGSPDDPTHSVRRSMDSPDIPTLFVSPLCTPSPSQRWDLYHPLFEHEWNVHGGAHHALPMVSEMPPYAEGTPYAEGLPPYPEDSPHSTSNPVMFNQAMPMDTPTHNQSTPPYLHYLPTIPSHHYVPMSPYLPHPNVAYAYHQPPYTSNPNRVHAQQPPRCMPLLQQQEPHHGALYPPSQTAANYRDNSGNDNSKRRRDTESTMGTVTRGQSGGGAIEDEPREEDGHVVSGAVRRGTTSKGDSGDKKEKDIHGQVLHLSRTQAGSKYLQRQLSRGPPMVVETILREVEEDISSMMCDAYGNYLCASAFQLCSSSQRLRMLEKLVPKLTVISCDKRGTHALQSLIGLLSTDEEQNLLFNAFDKNLIVLCLNPYGTHVVQRLLMCCQEDRGHHQAAMVIDHIVKHFTSVSQNPHGLCVLKKCIAITAPQSKNRKRDPVLARLQSLLLKELTRYALELVQSPFGNYAIQHAFEEWGDASSAYILKRFVGRIVRLSTQKFSSNVVESILTRFPRSRPMVVRELSAGAHELVASVYGHFVARKVISVAVGALLATFRRAISENLHEIQSRRLRSKWSRLVSEDPNPDDEYHDDDDDLQDDRHHHYEQHMAQAAQNRRQ
eukprot:GEMP01015520.1.p1 GENE.GEMP01015520.1~~GEMP01015520.1.p1  ORF type:complete len:709 (+),score=139.32 GEMP01015520.1:59-2185(+)